MAFIKLIPHEGREALPVDEIINRLRTEFEEVKVDEDQGRDHVGKMIAAVLKFSDSVPGKAEQLRHLQTLQMSSVYVTFGDEAYPYAACGVMPESELFFGSPNYIDGPGRPLIERAAAAINYRLTEG